VNIRGKNFLQYFLSFLKQIQIESTSGEFSGALEVVLFEGRYMLNSANATYSFEDRYTSYRTALGTIATEIKSMESALVLGLGLGSIPQMLQTKFKFKGIIDCVEIDSTIIQLAEKYYPEKKLHAQLQVHKSDALIWMQIKDATFDLITVDLFIDKHVPRQFHSESFLLNLKRALTPNGILLFSRLAENKKSEQELIKNLKKVFPGAIEIDTGGNLILCFRNAAEL
jgi:spermidine synthase